MVKLYLSLILILWSLVPSIASISVQGSGSLGPNMMYNIRVTTTIEGNLAPYMITYSTSTGYSEQDNQITTGDIYKEIVLDVSGVDMLTLTVTIMDNYGCETVKELEFSALYQCDIENIDEVELNINPHYPTSNTTSDGRIEANVSLSSGSNGQSGNVRLMWYLDDDLVGEGSEITNVMSGTYTLVYAYVNDGEQEACAQGEKTIVLDACTDRLGSLAIIPDPAIKEILRNSDTEHFEEDILRPGGIIYPSNFISQFEISPPIPSGDILNESTYNFNFTKDGCVLRHQVSVPEILLDPIFDNSSCDVYWEHSEDGPDFEHRLSFEEEITSENGCTNRARCPQDLSLGLSTVRSVETAKSFEHYRHERIWPNNNAPCNTGTVNGVTSYILQNNDGCISCPSIYLVSESGERCFGPFHPQNYEFDTYNQPNEEDCINRASDQPLSAKYNFVNFNREEVYACEDQNFNRVHIRVQQGSFPGFFSNCDQWIMNSCVHYNSWTRLGCPTAYFYQDTYGDWHEAPNSNGINIECTDIPEIVAQVYPDRLRVYDPEFDINDYIIFMPLDFALAERELWWKISLDNNNWEGLNIRDWDGGIPEPGKVEIVDPCTNPFPDNVSRSAVQEHPYITLDSSSSTVSDQEVTVYPTLTIEETNILSHNDLQRVHVYEMSGRLIINHNISQSGVKQLKIKLTSLEPGLYIIETETQDGQIHREKIIKGAD